MIIGFMCDSINPENNLFLDYLLLDNTLKIDYNNTIKTKNKHHKGGNIMKAYGANKANNLHGRKMQARCNREMFV